MTGTAAYTAGTDKYYGPMPLRLCYIAIKEACKTRATGTSMWDTEKTTLADCRYNMNIM